MVQPYVSAGGGSTGGFVRAGVGLTFADMLGDRQLQTAIQVGKGVDDFIGEAAYLNMRSRWTWGVIGEQVPWLIGAIQQPATLSADRQTVTAQADVFRQIHRDVGGVAIYPFSGAKRLELSVGGQSITYDRESTIGSFSPITGSLLNSSTSTTTAAPTAYLAETSAAFVYDSSEFGPSSPILGQRYRLAISPSFGSMSFATVTADYRKYVMPIRPLTIAMRAMYLGRYGSGAEDPRLLPLAWTLRDLVRGYGDTGPIVGGLSYLTAPRMLIANVEARFPIPGIFTGSMQPLGLPIEGLFFSDAGQFWTPSSLTGSTPPMLRSIGAGVRLTAAGLVFELDAARPIDNVSTGWRFAFNFRPGF
jgi:hypothetical protein